MKKVLAFVVVVAAFTLSLQAAEPPEWLADLRLVESALLQFGQPLPIHKHFNHAPGDNTIAVDEIKTIASFAKAPTDLDKALLVLPTKERRDRAYKTLISYTRWQPQPAFTPDGAHGGHPAK